MWNYQRTNKNYVKKGEFHGSQRQGTEGIGYLSILVSESWFCFNLQGRLERFLNHCMLALLEILRALSLEVITGFEHTLSINSYILLCSSLLGVFVANN